MGLKIYRNPLLDEIVAPSSLITYFVQRRLDSLAVLLSLWLPMKIVDVQAGATIKAGHLWSTAARQIFYRRLFSV